MRVGIISNTEFFIPFCYALVAQKLQVQVFFSPSGDVFSNQKVYSFVQGMNLPFVNESGSADLYSWLMQGNYDACFVLGYHQLIDLDRLKAVNKQLYNIHFGPLPYFKGAVPVFWQLKQGSGSIGLAIHRMSEKFDSGAIVWEKDLPDQPHYNYQIVNMVLSNLCVEGVFYILNLLLSDLKIPGIDIANRDAAYQKRPALNDVLINWEMMSAVKICNLIRACNPWNKGALTFFKGQDIKLMDASVAELQQDRAAEPGTILQIDRFLQVYCQDGQAININMLFYNDCFLPAYQCELLGIVAGQKFG